MVLTKFALACAMLTAGQTQPDVHYTNLRSGRIPSQVDPQRAAEIREMKLFLSSDRGKSWNEVDRITADKEGFNYQVPSDGEYWYHVVVVNQQGKQEPADLFQTRPLMKLVVDTKPPELKITSAQRQGDELVVSWQVREDNPDPPKLQLEYRSADSTAWTPITLTPNPQGTARTRVTTAAPLVVRLRFIDQAKNVAQVEEQVQGGVAAAQYNPSAPAAKAPEPRGPDVPPLPGLDKPPPAPVGPPVPPPPAPLVENRGVGNSGAVPPAVGQAPGSPAPVTNPPGPPMPAPKAIASTSDTSQGSPIPANTQAAKAPRVMPEVQFVNDPEIVLEYEVSKVGPSGVGKVEVWITRDNGASWVRFAEDPDAGLATSGGKYKRSLILPGEGVFGVSLLVKNKAGMSKLPPRPGDIPEMLVEVDTTPPQAQLHALQPDPQRRDTLLLSWMAKDRNLSATPVTLEWAERPSGPWQAIAGDLPNSGRHSWKLPPSLPSHVYFKMTVRDTAGNVAVAVTPEPQLVDLCEPEGRLLRVIPANKNNGK